MSDATGNSADSASSPDRPPPVLHQRDVRGVHTLVLNRPAAFNALSEDVLGALQTARISAKIVGGASMFGQLVNGTGINVGERNIAAVQRLAVPRLPALAEVGWSAQRARDWPAFRERLASHAVRWELLGINWFPSPEIAW